MKVLIFGGEKNYAQNLSTWINATGNHQALVWEKLKKENLVNESGDHIGSRIISCPMPDPDIVLFFAGYVSREELTAMGITTNPRRVNYRLANKNYTGLLRDEEEILCSDAYASYNPEHKDDQISLLPNRFNNMKTLPLPLDLSSYQQVDYSNDTLSIYASKSLNAINWRSPKGVITIAHACKQNQVPADYLRGLDPVTFATRRASHPVFFDNWVGGIWGASTYEAMALGQAVICKASNAVVNAYSQMFGSPFPILTAQTIPELVQLVADLKSGSINWKAKCLESRVFMEVHYTPQVIANLYLNYFQTLLQ